MTTIKLPTVKKILVESWDIYKKTWDLWLLGLFIAIFANIFSLDKSMFISSFFAIIFSLSLLEGKLYSFTDIAKNISLYKLWRFGIASLILGLFILLGLVLFVIPGIYIILRYQLLPYIYALNEDLDLKEAYYEVKNITKPILGKYLGLNISLILIFSFALIITLGLSIFVIAPISIIANSIIYKTLFQKE